jgi:hypothetical protein
MLQSLELVLQKQIMKIPMSPIIRFISTNLICCKISCLGQKDMLQLKLQQEV